ncbi:MAG: hypothetical protein WD871_16225 [Xanthobacteraceae bacterium]
MPQALMIVGAILVLVGLGGIAAGAPDWVLGLSLGATLIQSGAIAFVGGIVVIALALVLNTLQQLLRRLDSVVPAQTARSASTQSARHGTEPKNYSIVPAPVTPAHPVHEPHAEEPRHWPGEDMPEEEPVRARRDAAPKFGEEPPRSRRESLPPFASDEQMRVRRDAPPNLAGDESARMRRDRFPDLSGAESARPRDAAASARRDEPARQRRELPPPSPPPPPPPLPMLPDERRRPRYPGDASAIPGSPLRLRPAAPSTGAERSSAETTVVRSGVIGGMAYTLYADGSIEAELPIGTVRFGSIAELQDHVLRTGAEADVDFKESAR